MTERSDPLRPMHREAEAAFTTFPAPGSIFAEGEDSVETVADFGDGEAERRALREGAGLIDLPWRRIIRVTGDERLPFLNRMLTQELKGLEPGHATSAFWLNRKGRIVADLRVLHFERETLLEADAPVMALAMESLQSFIIMDDVELADAATQWRTLGLSGPRALEWARQAAGDDLIDLAPGDARRVTFGGVEVIVDRDDAFGPHGVRVLTPVAQLVEAHHHLNEIGATLNNEKDRACRMVGWDAFDAERIESGRPMFLVDYGTTSLPHESGALASRVSFTKGCFLGQEVVARMRSLGQPKQKCVALRIESDERPAPGAKLFPAGSTESDAVGVVTSAAAMDGERRFAALAQVKTRHAVAQESLRLSGGGNATIHAILGS